MASPEPKKIYRICAATGARADYGLLRPLLYRLAAEPGAELRLVVTGMHLSAEFGGACREIESDGFKIDAKIDALTPDDTPAGTVKSIGLGMISFAGYFAERRPDMLVLLGDRYESFAAAVAAAVARIPIAHIYGGDVTEGAVDDFFRHSITKMSSLHFVSNDLSLRRVVQLGEQPDRVFNSGALCVELARDTALPRREELERELGLDLSGRYALVTYHPATLTGGDPVSEVRALLDALEMFPDILFLVTKSNSDSGGRRINRELERRCGRTANCRLFGSFGAERYMALMRGAAAVIGNSSSGLYESPLFGIPAVNVGDRQKGRCRPDSVINCEPVCDDIVLAIKKAVSADFTEFAKRAGNPYGAGDASLIILKRIMEYLRSGRAGSAKQFYLIDR